MYVHVCAFVGVGGSTTSVRGRGNCHNLYVGMGCHNLCRMGCHNLQFGDGIIVTTSMRGWVATTSMGMGCHNLYGDGLLQPLSG